VSVKYGMAAITSEVLGEVKREAEAIIAKAEADAKETVRAAKALADQNYGVIISQGKLRAEAEKRKIASVTDVESRNSLLQAKDDLVDAVFQKAINKLQEFTGTQQYRGYLLKEAEALAKQLKQKSLMVQVNAKDKTWLTPGVLKEVSQKAGCELKLADEAGQFIGGLKTQTEDGKITFDDTFDNRLEQLKPDLRVQAAKVLFGKEV
jgi:V/A-type H+-transporting ATPase subunit E